MDKAETYIEIWAICPHCGENQSVEWVYETVDGKEEWTCGQCGEEFSYAHPENNYGH